MKRLRLCVCLLLGISLFLALIVPAAAHRPLLKAWPSADLAPNPLGGVRLLPEKPAGAPLLYQENVGQFHDAARFQVAAGEGTLYLTEDALWLTLVERPNADDSRRESFDKRRGSEFPPAAEGGLPRRGVHLRLSFVGANPRPLLEPFDRVNANVAYFLGNDPTKWRPSVPVWGGVRYRELYTGVDLELASGDGRLQLRLVARPEADLASVALRVEGARGLAANEGELIVETAAGKFGLPLLQVVDANGKALPVPSAAPELAGQVVSAPFAASQVNDPGVEVSSHTAMGSADLLFSTFLGGTGSDYGLGVAVDSQGYAYVTGTSVSTDFPLTPGELSYTGSSAYVYVTKLAPDGSTLVYSAHLGGFGGSIAMGVAVDPSGSAYVSGHTDSNEFPTTLGAFDTTYNDSRDAFVVKLSPDGNRLDYGTYIGGASVDSGQAVRVDGQGNVYVGGQTNSVDFPVVPGSFDTTFDGGWTPFVLKLAPDGASLVYATFLGGNETYCWSCYSLAVDRTGCAYLTGPTTSAAAFPVTDGAFDTTYNGGTSDVGVVKLNPTGSAPVYGTLLGSGNYEEEVSRAIAVDADGNAYIVGIASASFPHTPGAFFSDSGDAFVAKLNAIGDSLVYGAILGGDDTFPYGVAVDGLGNAYIVGGDLAPTFPTTPGAFDETPQYSDGFLIKLNPSGSGILYGTGLGGWWQDAFNSVALDGNGNVYVTGTTGSADFPTTLGVYDGSYSGGDRDAFVAKFALGNYLTTYAVSGRATDELGRPLSGVRVTARTGYSTVTGPDGTYRFQLAPGDYTITPARECSTFVPSSIQLNLAADSAGKDFVSHPSCSVSGRITSLGGVPLAGVTIASGAITATTNASGEYSLTGLDQGTHAVVPTKEGFAFSPSSREATVPPNASGADFTGVSRGFLPLVLNKHRTPFFDDFSNPASGWPSEEDEIAAWGYRDGEYSLLMKQPGWLVLAGPGISATDFEVQFDVRAAGHIEGTHGVYFAYRDAGFIMFEMSDGYYRMRRYDANAGRWYTLMGPAFSPAIRRGNQTNNVRVVRTVGGETQVYINGNYIGSASEVSLTEGTVGFVAAGYEPYYEARFDNFSLRPTASAAGVGVLSFSGGGGMAIEQKAIRDGIPRLGTR